MKKIILCMLIVTCAFHAFSQQTDPAPALTKQDYLKKSKNQKTAAWLLAGGGTVLIITGIIIYSNDVNSENDPWNAFVKSFTSSGLVIGGIGVLVSAGCIPLFIASGKNKRKAMSMSFKFQDTPRLQNATVDNRYVPSMSLKINL